METTPQKYQAYVRQKQKKSPLAKDMALAFLVGGLICVLGQLILDAYTAAGLHQELVRNGYRTYPEIRVERVGE